MIPGLIVFVLGYDDDDDDGMGMGIAREIKKLISCLLLCPKVLGCVCKCLALQGWL